MPVSAWLHSAKQRLIELNFGRSSKMKQKCGGEKPHCGRCRGRGQTCYYSPHQRQRDFARRKTADNANVTTEPLEQPGPMESAPVRNRNRTPTLRRLLPYPEEPGAAFGGSAVGSVLPPQYSEEFDETWGGWDARPNGFDQNLQEPDWTFGVVDARPNEFLRRPQESFLTFGGLGTRSYGPLQYPQQPDLAFGGYQPQLNGPSLYTRHPSMTLAGHTPFAENLVAHQNGPGTGPVFNKPIQWTDSDGVPPF